MTATTLHKSSQLNWLAILRSMTIILVIMNHVRLLNLSTGDTYAFILNINNFFQPMRMPVFIMVSGALLYHTRIRSGWSTANLYWDKLQRIGLPLVFCTILGNVAQLVFNSFVKHPLDVSPQTFFESFVLYDGYPWPHRWYLASLLTMMALYPIFVRLQKSWSACLTILLLLLIYPLNHDACCPKNWFQIFSLNRYLIFFYIGLVIFQFDLWRYVQRNPLYVAIGLWCGYIVGYFTHITTLPLISETIPLVQIYCIIMMIATAMAVEQWASNAFSLIRKYIFQIYLFGIAFQACIELICWRSIGCPSSMVMVFYLLNILAGIYAPIGMSRLIEKIPCTFLQLCFGLKPQTSTKTKSSTKIE